MPGPIFRCERCKIAPERKGGFDDGGFDQESAASVRLAEIQANFGFIGFMCLNCRREWTRWLNVSKTSREYSETGFCLDHWRTAHRKTGTGKLDEGLALIRKINDLDDRLYNEAMAWLRTPPTDAEWKKRGDRPAAPDKSDDDEDDDKDYGKGYDKGRGY